MGVRRRDRPVATGADIDYLLAKANALLARAAHPRRRRTASPPACARSWPTRPAADTTRISRSHRIEPPLPWLTTIAGGKYTTYRVMAADLVDTVQRALGAHRRLGDPRHPAAGRARGRRRSFACTHEGALHLDDVLERRTRTALTAPDRGLSAAAPGRRADGRRARLEPARTRAEVDG